MEHLSIIFQKKRKKNMRLSFITQLNTEFLMLFAGCRKVLGKMQSKITRSCYFKHFGFSVEFLRLKIK